MKASKFKELLEGISSLSRVQRDKLHEELLKINGDKPVEELIEKHESQVLCPDCGSPFCSRNGIISGLQRYKCKACRRTFNRLSGTSFSRLRKKEKWLGVVDCLQRKDSLSTMCEKLEVNRKTSVRWRHRFLKGFTARKGAQLGGIVETDETFFRMSEKGSRKLTRSSHKRGKDKAKRGIAIEEYSTVIVARDRTKESDYSVTQKRDSDAVKDFLKSRIQKGSILCTDGKNTYGKFSREEGIQHVVLNLSKGERIKDSVFHIQNVNSFHVQMAE
jgi:transposase-like protein